MSILIKACSVFAWFHIFVGCHLKDVVKWWIVQLNCITPLLSIFLWKKTTGWRRDDAQDAGTSQIWKPFLDPHQPRLTHRHTLNSLLPSAPSSGNNMIWPCMLLKWTTQIANFLGLLIHFISAQTICHKKKSLRRFRWFLITRWWRRWKGWSSSCLNWLCFSFALIWQICFQAGY